MHWQAAAARNWIFIYIILLLFYLFLFFMLIILFYVGGNVTSFGSELLQDVWHLVRRSRHTWTAVCLPELVGTHNTLSRNHCHGPRRQQRSCLTAKNCPHTGMLYAFCCFTCILRFILRCQAFWSSHEMYLVASSKAEVMRAVQFDCHLFILSFIVVQHYCGFHWNLMCYDWATVLASPPADN